MAKPPQMPVLICCEASRYRIGMTSAKGPSLADVDVPRDATPAQIAAQLAASVGRGRSAVVGLPSMGCLVANVRTADLPRKNKRRAMLYRLEEHLPVAAEDLSADFIDCGDGALGVAVPSEAWSALLDAMRDASLRVEAVCPVALLALQAHLAASPAIPDGAGDCDALLWQDGDRLELFFLAAGRLDGWYVLPAEAADVALAIGAHVARSPGRFRIATRALDSQLQQQIAALTNVEIVASDTGGRGSQSISHAAVEAADGIINRRRKPLVDLSRDDARTDGGGASSANPVRALAAVSLCCLCIAAALFWRATRYTAVAGRFDAEKLEIFRQAFPGQGAPVGIASRLRSVEEELRGGVAGDRAAVSGPPVLAVLHETLARLPADVRCRWTELRFDPGALALEGEVLRHADAGAIAAALRKSRLLERFAIDEPQTRQLDGGAVGFSIGGALPIARRAEGGAP